MGEFLIKKRNLSFVVAEFKAIDSFINDILYDGQDSYIREIVSYSLKGDSKKIRSGLLILLFKAMNHHKDPNLIKLCAAIELIHTATLIHDDVIDNADTRRGISAMNVQWGNKKAILSGDFLFSKAFEILATFNNKQCLELMIKACINLSSGELAQMARQKKMISYEEYLDIIDKKTAYLFFIAGTFAGILSEQNKSMIDNLGKLGHILGMIFQMTDDILDYRTSGLALSKTSGNDFFENKMTFPLIVLMTCGQKEKLWKRFQSNNKEDFDYFVHRMQDKDVIAATYKIVDKYRKNAMMIIDSFSPSKYNEALKKLINLAFDRGF